MALLHAGRRWRRSRPLLILALCATAMATLPAARVRAGSPPDEVRALWVLRASLATPQAVAHVVETARAAGFNTLLVQVRARGDAVFASRVEPRAPRTGSGDDFDALAEVLAVARRAGLRVHAWVNVNLVSSAAQLPAAREHVIYRHPEWLMVPRAVAEAPALVDPKSPAYIGTIARWTRANAQDVEGLYLSPIHAGAAAHTTAAVTEIVDRYPVDGIHLDYVRYPNDAFDYSRGAIAEFRAERLAGLSTADRQPLDERAQVDLFAWPDAFPEAWVRFRQSRLTSLVMRLRTAVKARRPDVIFSAAVIADMLDAQHRRLQDWRTWLEMGLLDVACPLAYTPDAKTFAAQIAAARQIPGFHGLWAGIGAYRLAPAQTIDHIAAARAQGASGIALFSYDSLAAVANQPTYLADVGRLAFGTGTPAVTGSR